MPDAMSSIMRLPSSLRIYIFGLSGLGSKLLLESEVPWSSICLEIDNTEAVVRYHEEDGVLYSVSEQKHKDLQLAAQEQAFRHPLYKVSRQFRLEARCALLKYNVIELVASSESFPTYERWLPEYFKALDEISIVPCDVAATEKLVRLLKEVSNFSNLKIHIQEGLRYDSMWEDAMGLKPGEHVETEEQYEKLVPQWLEFRGAKDVFIYYASRFYLESKHEKMVMGGEYDSEAKGKLSPDFRDWEWPWCKSHPPNPMVEY